MEIKVNGDKRIVHSDSLQMLASEVLGEKTAGVAIAVNNRVVPKQKWSEIKLQESDQVLIIRATQGG
jgi:sulfur carrier protein